MEYEPDFLCEVHPYMYFLPQYLCVCVSSVLLDELCTALIALIVEKLLFVCFIQFFLYFETRISSVCFHMPCVCFYRHHTVTRGITKGVKEDFRLAMERQVSRCGENLFTVLHRFCINEKIILIQSLP